MHFLKAGNQANADDCLVMGNLFLQKDYFLNQSTGLKNRSDGQIKLLLSPYMDCFRSR